MDKRFRVEVLSQTDTPQRVIYFAMHQDYSETFVWDRQDKGPTEAKAGETLVERLLNGGRGHYGCYSSDTQVLTRRGWCYWPDVTAEDWLVAVDYTNGSCHFEQPSKLWNQPFNPSDKMYGVRGMYIDQMVTHDHRMIISSKQGSGAFTPWRAASAESVIGKPVRYMLNACLSNDDRTLPDDLPSGYSVTQLFKIAGFYFGDGQRSGERATCTKLRFRLRRPRKIAYIHSLGVEVGYQKGERFTIDDPALTAWVKKHFTTADDKAVPDWLLTLPMDAVAAFWDGLKNSDGTRVVEKSWAYDSTSKAALELIQATAHINGFSANMTLNNRNEGPGHENHRPCWRLTISEHATYRVEISQKGRSPGAWEGWCDYSGRVYCASVSTGALMVRRNHKVVVSGNCLEHPQIVLNIGWFPHSCMQQIRTHRVGVSFDVQSFRYTGSRILAVAEGNTEVEDVFYLRPVGFYTNREGKKYHYTEEQRSDDLVYCVQAATRYAERIEQGFAEEHARSLIPFDVRQHWVMSANVRSLMHIMDLRAKADAQLEAQQMCELIWPHFEAWVPAIAAWYKDKRWKKAKLAP